MAAGGWQKAEVNEGKPWTSTEGGRKNRAIAEQGVRVPFWSPAA